MNAMHQAVLLNEAIEGLKIVPHGIYIDGTFGRGGHSKAILNQLNETGRLFAFDKDQEAIEFAQQHIIDKRFTIVHESFAQLESIAQRYKVAGKVDGVLLDLGVSSPQLDDAHRGFSFLKQGPLDMRMNHEQAFDAANFINHASIEEMAHVFKTYGEERFSLRIAKAIVQSRQTHGPIQTTEMLAEIVKAANPKWEKHKHPATRVFQAIRIHVNSELDDLIQGLKAAVNVLAPGGRLAVISFHSLEDRIVKQFMKTEEEGVPIPVGVPIKTKELAKTFQRIGKAIKPTEEEMQYNVRARSAVLRIGEKIS